MAYYGYQAADKKEKAGKTLKDEKKATEAGIKYWKFVALWNKQAAGHKLVKTEGAKPVDEPEDLRLGYEDFVKGTYNNEPSHDAVQTMINEDQELLGDPFVDPQTKKRMLRKFDATKAQLTNSYKAEVDRLKAEVDKLKKANKTLKNNYDSLLTKEKDRDTANTTAWTALKSNIKEFNDRAEKARQDYNTQFAKAKKAEDNADKKFEKQVDDLKKDFEEKRKEFDRLVKEKNDKLALLMAQQARERRPAEGEKEGEGKAAEGDKGNEQRVAKTNLLAHDVPKGKIIRVDFTGKMPYINLGSADGVKEQLTFSVYGRTASGKVEKDPKASLEVVKVIDGHLSQTRVTYMRDLSGEPLVAGDVVYNPVWNPNQVTHVAIAGIVDFTGEDSGTVIDQMRSLMEFMNNLKRQNIIVDAYLNLRELKPVGEITLKTDYFILAEGPEYDAGRVVNGKDEKANTKAQVNQAMEAMRQDAIKKGVTIIPLHKFAILTGYRVPRSTRNAYAQKEESDQGKESGPKANGEEEKPKKEKKEDAKLGEDKEKGDKKEEKGDKKDKEKKKKKEEDE
jgi:hypothetical protein